MNEEVGTLVCDIIGEAEEVEKQLQHCNCRESWLKRRAYNEYSFHLSLKRNS